MLWCWDLFHIDDDETSDFIYNFILFYFLILFTICHRFLEVWFSFRIVDSTVVPYDSCDCRRFYIAFFFQLLCRWHLKWALRRIVKFVTLLAIFSLVVAIEITETSRIVRKKKRISSETAQHPGYVHSLKRNVLAVHVSLFFFIYLFFSSFFLLFLLSSSFLLSFFSCFF